MKLNNSYYYDYLFKFVLSGETASGKSSVLRKFVYGTFDPFFQATIGVDFESKIVNVNDQRVKLQLWDTAGQDRYRSITKSYYRGTTVAFVVFDVTDKRSFRKLPVWLKEIQDMADKDTHIMILGNKVDGEREVNYDDIEPYLISGHFRYREISAKTGKGVKESFMEMAQIVLDQVESNRWTPDRFKDLGISKIDHLSIRDFYNFDDNERKMCCYN